MRRITFLSCLLFALGAAGCQDQLTQPQSPGEASNETVVDAPGSSPAAATIDLSTLRPESERLIEHRSLADAAMRVINEENYQCTASTALDEIVTTKLIESISAGDLGILLALVGDETVRQIPIPADFLPSLEAQFLLTADGPQEFGYDGDFTSLINNVERDTKRFWDIPSENIQVVAMKGSMLVDVERVAALHEFFGFPSGLSVAIATFIRDQILSSQTLDGGDYFLFSANAFALSSSGLPEKIAMGDGIMELYAELGFREVGTEAIFAHEFAHHVQFELDVPSDPVPSLDPNGPDEAEETRYLELMADAMAAYYLTHKRGGTYNWWRVEDFLRVYFTVGDCFFDNPGHHGTPEQRLRAARLGFDLASDAQMQGQILSSEAVRDHFNENFLDLIAPDIGAPSPDPNVDPGNSSGVGKGPAV